VLFDMLSRHCHVVGMSTEMRQSRA
jgi:hypothetical protein